MCTHLCDLDLCFVGADLILCCLVFRGGTSVEWGGVALPLAWAGIHYVVAHATVYASPILLPLLLFLEWDQLSFRILLFCFSSFQLYYTFKGPLLSLVLALEFSALMLDFVVNDIHFLQLPSPFNGSSSQVLIVCHYYAEITRGSIKDNIDYMIIGHIGINDHPIHSFGYFCTVPVIFWLRSHYMPIQPDYGIHGTFCVLL